ncbi:MAG TPA: 4-(cytidine 5'-diphospho)-2-C-methyl-D-erythritol kinase [Candidatus Xenobia bacterium]|jgi:4-diphosphocytidyl-2-C-methyl-D-erythritol kinase
MSSLKLAAHAKVNLCLCLGTRQADGFHAIDTIFHSLALHDDVRLDVQPGSGRVTLEVEGDPTVPEDDTNLAWRAAHMVLGPAPFDVHVRLLKRIPSGAGLGGGSADAAAVLVGLNSMLPEPIFDDALLELAAHLGSDVPFAVRGGTARGRGRGQLLTTLPTPSGWHFVLVKPPFSIATAWCYGEWSKEARLLDGRAVCVPAGDVRATLHNDFEPVVFPQYPALATIKQRLLAAGCLGALMTGSGSCVYGMVPTADEAERVAKAIADVPGLVLTTASRDQGVGQVVLR